MTTGLPTHLYCAWKHSLAPPSIQYVSFVEWIFSGLVSTKIFVSLLPVHCAELYLTIAHISSQPPTSYAISTSTRRWPQDSEPRCAVSLTTQCSAHNVLPIGTSFISRRCLVSSFLLMIKFVFLFMLIQESPFVSVVDDVWDDNNVLPGSIWTWNGIAIQEGATKGHQGLWNRLE